ncbi:unnamed protein product [Gadus morhua 'NCC']
MKKTVKSGYWSALIGLEQANSDTPPTQTPGRGSSWVKEDQKVWRDAEEPTPDLGDRLEDNETSPNLLNTPNQTPGRRSSWVKEEQKVWRCVSVSEDPPPPGDTL